MQLIFEQIRTGGDRNFGYLLADRGAGVGVAIDPSYDPATIAQRAAEQQITITHIINTHGHPDHINGNDQMRVLTGAKTAAHRDLPVNVDVPLGEGSRLAVGGLTLSFLATPGHAADHLIVYEPAHGLLVTGDLLFVGKVGGTRSDEDAATEWHSLQRMLREVPDHATVWPGHDYGVRPSSTIGLERSTNPFLRCENLAAFLELKRGWADVKKRLGLK